MRSEKVLITAIIAVALIECMALYMGIDGAYLAGAIGAVCALAGVTGGYGYKAYQIKKAICRIERVLDEPKDVDDTEMLEPEDIVSDLAEFELEDLKPDEEEDEG